jgi:Outer membrane protein
MSYTIYDFGSRGAALDESRAQYEYEALTYNRLLQQVKQEVTDAYWDYLAAVEILDDDRLDYEDYVSLVDVSKKALDAGVITRDTFLLARTEMLGAKLTYVEQINTVNTALYELKQLIGIPADTEMEIETGFPECEEISLPSLSKLLMEAKEARPDYLALQKLVTSAEAAVSSAKSAFFPTLTFDATYDKTYYSRGPNPSYDLTGEVGLSYDIFSRF